MKFIRQFCIILLISFMAEILRALIALPIPASIYGLVLMFAALKIRLIPLHSVRETGSFLIEIMPLMFIPPAVGLMESWGELEEIWLPLLAIILLTTLIVMAVSGITAQKVLRWEEGRRP